jgi:hypothetical protein
MEASLTVSFKDSAILEIRRKFTSYISIPATFEVVERSVKYGILTVSIPKLGKDIMRNTIETLGIFEADCNALSKIWYPDHDNPILHYKFHVSRRDGYRNVVGALSLDSERDVIFKTNVEVGLRLYNRWHTSLLQVLDLNLGTPNLKLQTIKTTATPTRWQLGQQLG